VTPEEIAETIAILARQRKRKEDGSEGEK